MKLNTTELNYIQNAVETANVLGIKALIIEPNCVRGINEERSALLIHTANVPDMPFGTIGLTRLNEFKSRYEIARLNQNFEMEAVVSSDKTPFARSLVMKAKGIQIDYRCASPSTIVCPKALNDTIVHRVKMNPNAVLMLSRGQSAMGSDVVQFMAHADGVNLLLADINGDILSHNIETSIETQSGEPTEAKFNFSYPIKMVLPLLKENSDAYVYFTQRGVITAPINGLTVWIPPRIQ